jgi:hypothetical protein
MITNFFTGSELIVLDMLPKGHKFKQRYFVGHTFPDLKRGNVNFHRRIPQATFWVDIIHMDSSMCPNGSKAALKFENRYVSRLPHKFNSSDEIEGAITKVWDELTFGEVQSIFRNWMSRFAQVIAKGGEYIVE